MPEKRRTSNNRRRTDDEDAAPAGEERIDDEDADEERTAADERAAGDERADDEDAAPAHEGRSADGRISAADAARAGMKGLAELVGKKPQGVTSVEPTDEGWRVGVEILEDERVPSTADILAIYEADLDSGGSLLSYRRTRRYPRGRSDNGDGDR